jgi:hypothetical protein
MGRSMPLLRRGFVIAMDPIDLSISMVLSPLWVDSLDYPQQQVQVEGLCVGLGSEPTNTNREIEAHPLKMDSLLRER